MDTLDIHLRVSGELKAQIERAVAAGESHSAEACASELMSEGLAGRKSAHERLIADLLDAADGPFEPLDDREWQSIRDEIRSRREARLRVGR